MTLDYALLIVKPTLVLRGEDKTLLDQFFHEGFVILEKKHCQLSVGDASIVFRGEMKNDNAAFQSKVIEFTKSPVCVAVLCHSEGNTASRLEEVAKRYEEAQGYSIGDYSTNAWRTLYLLDFFFSYLDTCGVERTLGMIKPNAMDFSNEIFRLIDESGLKILKRKKKVLSKEEIEELYQEHKEKAFFPNLQSILSSPKGVYLMVLEGKGCVEKWRLLMGPTKASVAKLEAPWSIRGQYALDNTENAVHGSDSTFSAKREIDIFFSPAEILLRGQEAEKGEGGKENVLSFDIPSDNDFKKWISRVNYWGGDALHAAQPGTVPAAKTGTVSCDATLSELLASGIAEMTKKGVRGLEALDWLANWLDEANPLKTIPRECKLVPLKEKKGDARLAEEVKEAKKEIKLCEEKAEEMRQEEHKGEEKKPYLVSILGVSSSGKTSLCERISKLDESWDVINPWKEVDEEIQSKTALGLQLSENTSPSLVVDVIEKRMRQLTLLHTRKQGTTSLSPVISGRFLLDGFPVTREEKEEIESRVGYLNHVFFLETSDTVVLDRMRKKNEEEALKTLTARVAKEKLLIDEMKGVLSLTGRMTPVEQEERVGEEGRDISIGLCAEKCLEFITPEIVFLLGTGPVNESFGKKVERELSIPMVDVRDIGRRVRHGDRTLSRAFKKTGEIKIGRIAPLLVDEISKHLRNGFNKVLVVNCISNEALIDYVRECVRMRVGFFKIDMERHFLMRTLITEIECEECEEKKPEDRKEKSSLIELQRQLKHFYSIPSLQLEEKLEESGTLQRVNVNEFFDNGNPLEIGTIGALLQKVLAFFVKHFSSSVTLLEGAPGVEAGDIAKELQKSLVAEDLIDGLTTEEKKRKRLDSAVIDLSLLEESLRKAKGARGTKRSILLQKAVNDRNLSNVILVNARLQTICEDACFRKHFHVDRTILLPGEDLKTESQEEKVKEELEKWNHTYSIYNTDDMYDKCKVLTVHAGEKKEDVVARIQKEVYEPSLLCILAPTPILADVSPLEETYSSPSLPNPQQLLQYFLQSTKRTTLEISRNQDIQTALTERTKRYQALLKTLEETPSAKLAEGDLLDLLHYGFRLLRRGLLSEVKGLVIKPKEGEEDEASGDKEEGEGVKKKRAIHYKPLVENKDILLLHNFLQTKEQLDAAEAAQLKLQKVVLLTCNNEEAMKEALGEQEGFDSAAFEESYPIYKTNARRILRKAEEVEEEKEEEEEEDEEAAKEKTVTKKPVEEVVLPSYLLPIEISVFTPQEVLQQVAVAMRPEVILLNCLDYNGLHDLASILLVSETMEVRRSLNVCVVNALSLVLEGECEDRKKEVIKAIEKNDYSESHFKCQLTLNEWRERLGKALNRHLMTPVLLIGYPFVSSNPLMKNVSIRDQMTVLEKVGVVKAVLKLDVSPEVFPHEGEEGNDVLFSERNHLGGCVNAANVLGSFYESSMRPLIVRVPKASDMRTFITSCTQLRERLVVNLPHLAKDSFKVSSE